MIQITKVKNSAYTVDKYEVFFEEDGVEYFLYVRTNSSPKKKDKVSCTFTYMYNKSCNRIFYSRCTEVTTEEVIRWFTDRKCVVIKEDNDSTVYFYPDKKIYVGVRDARDGKSYHMTVNFIEINRSYYVNVINNGMDIQDQVEFTILLAAKDFNYDVSDFIFN